MNASVTGSPIVHKAAQDVRLLIAHVARQGKALEPAEFVSLISAVEKIDAGTVQPQDEAVFWKIYAELVKLAEPATIDSLYFDDYVNSLGGATLNQGDWPELDISSKSFYPG